MVRVNPPNPPTRGGSGRVDIFDPFKEVGWVGSTRLSSNPRWVGPGWPVGPVLTPLLRITLVDLLSLPNEGIFLLVVGTFEMPRDFFTELWSFELSLVPWSELVHTSNSNPIRGFLRVTVSAC